MYYLLRLAASLIPRLPRRLVSWLGVVVGFIAWLFAGKARRQADENMLHVLGSQDGQSREFLRTRAGRKRLRRVVRGMFRQNVSNYLNLFLLPSLKAETILQSMQVRGLEHLQQALAGGKGVIFFSAHLGPFDYLIQWLAIQGYEVTIPVEHLADRRVLELVLRLRRSKGIQYVPLGGSAALRAMLQTLRKNQIVMITADRAVQGESALVPFFGAPARLPLGIAELAQRTGAPVLGGFGWRSERREEPRLVGEIVPVSSALPPEQRNQIEPLQRSIVSCMERFIGAHPDQWVVFAPVWAAEAATEKQLQAKALEKE
jgi:KDO2-lipid IV(A) lauroyltransferase